MQTVQSGTKTNDLWWFLGGYVVYHKTCLPQNRPLEIMIHQTEDEPGPYRSSNLLDLIQSAVLKEVTSSALSLPFVIPGDE